MIDDPELVGLALDRQRLLRKLAPVLRRPGKSHPNRAAEDRRRRHLRQEYESAIAKNAELIAARVLMLSDLSLE